MFLCLIGLCSVYFLGEDNLVEEIAEEIIETKTGENLDLTPQSPENKGDVSNVKPKDKAP